MDRSYKEDIPKMRRALEELKKERLLRSPKFARETARLRRGVAMFHSDLVYLRVNVKALKEILEVERRSHRGGQ